MYLSFPWVTIILKTLQILHFELVIGRPDVSNMKDVFLYIAFFICFGMVRYKEDRMLMIDELSAEYARFCLASLK